MTLLQIRNIIDYLLSLGPTKISLTKERFIDILSLASNMYFEEQCRLKNWDNLKPFIKICGDYDAPPMPVENGIMALPADFFRHMSAIYKYTVKTAAGVKEYSFPIEKTDDELFDNRNSNSVTKPTHRFPVINYQDDHARIRPKTIRHIVLTYLTAPTAPVYAQKAQAGVNVYDAANSVELQWSFDCQINVLQIALQHLGLKANRLDIVQAVENERTKEIQMTV